LFFASKEPFKRHNVKQKTFFGESCIFYYKNPFALVVYGKCMAKIFALAIVSLNLVPFTKESLCMIFYVA
jgi:hypothetical protein